MIWNKTEEALPFKGTWVLGRDDNGEYFIVRFIVEEEGTEEECPLWETNDNYLIALNFCAYWAYIPDIPWQWREEREAGF